MATKTKPPKAPPDPITKAPPGGSADGTIIIECWPHVVHGPETIREEPPGHFARYQAVTDCPDCTRGLTSRGSDMVCPVLGLEEELHGCHPQCVVACGS